MVEKNHGRGETPKKIYKHKILKKKSLRGVNAPVFLTKNFLDSIPFIDWWMKS